MKYWKQAVLFYLGGMSYTGVELLWRGWSHGSMFLLGGLCFLALGWMGKRFSSRIAAGVAGATTVTALELGCGLVVNRQFQIWDYRQMPLNFHGQICLPFCLLWLPLCLVGLELYRVLERYLFVDFS